MPYSNRENKLLKASALRCPSCESELIGYEKYLKCIKAHTFDKARQGYVNLLTVNQKNSKNPGDNQMMVASRAHFLNKGYYQKISDTLNMLINNQYSELLKENFHIADIGCGEGYYLSKLKNHLDNSLSKQGNYYGLDISKEAIKLAAIHNKSILWRVGSAVKLPLKSEAINIALSVFAPFYFNEFYRVLTDEGRLILITPASSHLIELRNILFANVTSKEEERLTKRAENYFKPEKIIPLKFQCKLNTSEDIKNLLTMTPFYFKASAESKERVLSLPELEVTVDVKISSFVKIKI